MSEEASADTAAHRSVIPAEFRWVVLLTIILVGGLLVAMNWQHAIHKLDPTAFAERSRPLLDGSLPYIDYEYEHLPLAIVPMAAAAVIERFVDVHYTLIFWSIMCGVIFGVGHLTNKLGSQLGVKNAAMRWLSISWALLPLISFRVDSLSVLLTLLALSLAIAQHERASAWAMAGAIAAKGWPIVLVAVDWWRGRRRRAVLTVIATMAGLAVLASFPYFRSGREFFGVHIETVTGAPTVLLRVLRGLPMQTDVAAGATYVEVGSWAMAVNLLVGGVIGVLGLRAMARQFTWKRAVDLVGVLTIAVMLVSPLLSAQFIFWITPFAAITTNNRVRIGTAAAAFLTGVFTTFWYFDAAWFWAVIVARNGFLVWTGWSWARHLARKSTESEREASSPHPVPA